jgi:hypothetical protein
VPAVARGVSEHGELIGIRLCDHGVEAHLTRFIHDLLEVAVSQRGSPQ